KVSPFVPHLEYSHVKGRLVPNWGMILKSVEESKERHLYISNIVRDERYKDKCILVLCNRVENTMGVYNLLKDAGERVDYLCGLKKKWDKTCRVLVAGFKKGGTGMNHLAFNMLIMASDTK